MNGTEKLNTVKDRDQGNDALVELFRHVSSRERAPAGDELAVRQAVHSEWRHLVRRRQRRRFVWAGALAASLALATTLAIRLAPSPGPTGERAPLAISGKLIGTAMIRSANGSARLLEESQTPLQSGQSVLTGVESRLAMQWRNGVKVGLDALSEIELISDAEVKLVAGQLYVDTAGGDAAMAAITIRTPQGLVSHVGTQFLARVSRNGTSVSVREGEVQYTPVPNGADAYPAGSIIAGAGEQLAVAQDGSVEIESIETWGQQWEWVETLSPGFHSDGKSLAELLDWAGRETGRKVWYETPEAESLAASTVLHGNLEVPPLEALAIATATSDLAARVDDGLIKVGLALPQ